MKSALRLAKLPRPERGHTERRIDRSDSTATALELALTHAAQRAQLDAMLLVDDSGMLVSNSDTKLDLAMLAAVTPIVGRGKALPRIRRNGEKRDLSVHTLEFEGELLYVAALGGNSGARRRELARSAAAAKRILAA